MIPLKFLKDAFDEAGDSAPAGDEGPAGGGMEHLAAVPGDAVGDGGGGCREAAADGGFAGAHEADEDDH